MSWPTQPTDTVYIWHLVEQDRIFVSDGGAQTAIDGLAGHILTSEDLNGLPGTAQGPNLISAERPTLRDDGGGDLYMDWRGGNSTGRSSAMDADFPASFQSGGYTFFGRIRNNEFAQGRRIFGNLNDGLPNSYMYLGGNNVSAPEFQISADGGYSGTDLEVWFPYNEWVNVVVRVNGADTVLMLDGHFVRAPLTLAQGIRRSAIASWNPLNLTQNQTGGIDGKLVGFVDRSLSIAEMGDFDRRLDDIDARWNISHDFVTEPFWDAATGSANADLQLDGTHVQLAAWNGVRSRASHSSGRYYLEFSVGPDLWNQNQVGIGVARVGSSESFLTGTGYLGDAADAVGYYSHTGNIYHNSADVQSLSPGYYHSTVRVLVDLDAGTVEFSMNGNAWSNPVSIPSGEYYFYAQGTSNAWAGIVQSASFKYDVPDNVEVWGAPSGPVPLLLDDAAHAHISSAADVGFSVVISVADALHAYDSDSVVATVAYEFAFDEAVHAHASSEVSVRHTSPIAVAGAAHAHAAGELVVLSHYLLAIPDATHYHRVDLVAFGAAEDTYFYSTVRLPAEDRASGVPAEQRVQSVVGELRVASVPSTGRRSSTRT